MKVERGTIRREDREAILAAANGRCPHCDATGVPLEIRHMVPLSEGGTSDLSNLEAICRNCHRAMDMVPSEVQFVAFLAELMEANPHFYAIEREPVVSAQGLRPDIIATEKLSSGSQRQLLVECKSLSVLSDARVAEAQQRLARYHKMVPHMQTVLAFPGKAAPEIVEKFSEEAIEVWDVDRIGALFKEQIRQARDGYYGFLFSRVLARPRPEKQLIQDLKLCPTGLPGWSTYQKLVDRVLEMLFCPPLSKPFSENADFEKINRRDLIFPNYASEGFWLTLRQRYSADYIMVDAKNGKGKVSKAHVLQVANYLKPHGVGMLAIIIGRRPPDRAAEITIREQWLMHSKLIVVLTDDDIEAMLLAHLAR